LRLVSADLHPIQTSQPNRIPFRKRDCLSLEVKMNFSEPTLSTVASRLPALRSRGSCRGFAVFENRCVVFESHLELVTLYLLAMMPDVVQIIDQPSAITFVDDDQIVRRHTFDFLIVLKDGTRILVAVKPAEKVARSGIGRTIELIAGQIGPGIADRIIVITDNDFTRVDRFNAQQAFECMRFPIPEHDEAIERITGDMLGSVKIADLVEASGLGGLGFRAVIRCIARGVLAPVTPKHRITPDSYVIRRHG
jgi:hypothetical protein